MGDFSTFASEIADAKSAGQLVQWTTAFAEALATKFDVPALRSARRTVSIIEEHGLSRSAAPLDLAKYLAACAQHGPTAAKGMFHRIMWLRTHLGMRFPMETPLIQQWRTAPSGHLPQQQEVLPIALFQWLCGQAEGIRNPQPSGQAVASAIILRALLSCLRHQHMLRATLEIETSNERTFVVLVSKGKTRGGAAFKIAIPSHVAAHNPLLTVLQGLIAERLGEDLSRTIFVPDLQSTTDGLLSPAVMLPRQMSYSRMTSMLNFFLAQLEASQRQGLRRLTTYALRRFLPTAAMSLSMSDADQDALGNWTDRVGNTHSKHEPMAVRYSATRLERSANTKRCLLAALSSIASRAQSPTWDSLAQMTGNKHLMEQDVLTEAWGNLSTLSQLTQAIPQLPLATMSASPPVDADSSSTSSSRSSSASSSADAVDAVETDATEVTWLLPKGPRSLLHVLHPSGEDGQAYCHRAPFVWGYTSGHGADEAAKTGRRWCTTCAASLGANGLNLIA
eukprot:4842989-Amphidinium_carterae.1